MGLNVKPIRQRTTSVDDDAAFERAVSKAPDYKPDPVSVAAPVPIKEKGVPMGNKRQITLTISPDLLRRVDEVATKTGQARAALINMAIYRALEGDIFK
jgi:hypothetical protein